MQLLDSPLFWLMAAALWWYFNYPHKQYWDDLTRHRLFTLRDELFLAAAQDSTLGFNHKAYQSVRAKLNGAIRHTHTISFLQFISTLYWIHRSPEIKHEVNARDEQFHDSLSSLSNEERKIVLRSLAMMHLFVLTHIVHSSAVLWVFLAPLIKLLKLFRMMRGVNRKLLRGNKMRRLWLRIDHALHMDDPDGHCA